MVSVAGVHLSAGAARTRWVAQGWEQNMSDQEQQRDPEIGQSFYGFVASEPRLTYHDGKPRLYFKAGQEHFDYAPDGSRIKLPTTFHDVVAFRGAAEYGARHLAKADWFLAQGDLKPNTNPNTGIESTEFIATRLGPDLARMNIEVGRPRRLSQMDPAERTQSHRQVTFTAPEQDQPDRDQPARAL